MTSETPRPSAITILDAQHLDSLTVLHRDAYQRSMLSALGHAVVRRYFLWQLERHHNSPFLAGVVDSGAVVGYVSGGTYHENVQVGFLRQNRGRILLGAVTHPAVLANPEFWSKVRGGLRGLRRYSHLSRIETSTTEPKRDSPTEERDFHVLSIAVAPTARRRGIGRLLLDAAAAEARRRGLAVMTASVARDNIPSLTLFQRSGFEVRSEVSGGLALERRLGGRP